MNLFYFILMCFCIVFWSTVSWNILLEYYIVKMTNSHNTLTLGQFTLDFDIVLGKGSTGDVYRGIEMVNLRSKSIYILESCNKSNKNGSNK